MSITYTYGDVLQLLNNQYPRIQSDASAPIYCDMANSLIWNESDWRVSIGELQPFYLAPLEQDYGPPNVAVPSDFLGLRYAELTNVGTQPATRYGPMGIDRDLNRTSMQALPNAISFNKATQTFRVYPTPPAGIGTGLWVVEGTYKKTPTKVTAANVASALIPFDDLYFPIIVQAVEYFYNNPKGNPQALMALRMEIQKMASTEAVNLGDLIMAPQAALVNW